MSDMVTNVMRYVNSVLLGVSAPNLTERVERGKMSRNGGRIVPWQHLHTGNSDRIVTRLTTWKHCWRLIGFIRTLHEAIRLWQRYPDWDIRANLG